MSEPQSQLHAAIATAKSGDKAGALRIVADLLMANPDDVNAWIVMAQLLDDPDKIIDCWQEVLRLQPDNQRARQEIERLRQGRTSASSQPISQGEVQTIQPTPVKSKNRGCMTGIAIVGILTIITIIVCGLPMYFNAVGTTVTGATFTPLLPTDTPLPPTATIDPDVAKANWDTVDIRELVKNPDKYIGDEIHYKGEVLNISEDASGALIQVWVRIPGGSEFDQEAVMVFWDGDTTGVYEGTTIEFWGYGLSSIEGTNAFGMTIQQPAIIAKYMTYFTN